MPVEAASLGHDRCAAQPVAELASMIAAPEPPSDEPPSDADVCNYEMQGDVTMRHDSFSGATICFANTGNRISQSPHPLQNLQFDSVNSHASRIRWPFDQCSAG